MREKPTILQVHNRYQIPGGEDTVAENERRLLEAQGHRVVRYFRDNKEMKDFSLLQSPCYCLIAFSFKTHFEDAFHHIRRLQVDNPLLFVFGGFHISVRRLR